MLHCNGSEAHLIELRGQIRADTIHEAWIEFTVSVGLGEGDASRSIRQHKVLHAFAILISSTAFITWTCASATCMCSCTTEGLRKISC